MNENLDLASVLPTRLSYHSLKEMTNCFSEDQVLGRGTYGKVYKGVNKDGEELAVKVLYDMPSRDDNDQRFDQEFHNLACLQHPNIVGFVGYCHETTRECVSSDGKMILADLTKRALCFEYMRNGSLDNHISDEFIGLDWHTRHALIKGICDGLKYLHEERQPPICHLDLKPGNILLDEGMVPKLADFGLSRLFIEERTQITTSPIGTFGYLPPEFINQHMISKKYDIFSLGVIIIKIMTGSTGYSKCGEMSSDKFIEIVHKNWRNRLHTESSCALESYSEQVKRCIEIALSCVQNDRQQRPSIGEIVNKLNEGEQGRESGGLSNTENLFGAVVDNYKLDKMGYMGKPKMLEDRAREALILVNEDDKDDKAFKYVRDLVPFFGRIRRGTLCLVYNATGDTLYNVTSHDWFGHISRPPYPKEIGNGQWAAFYHYYSIFKVGSVAAVVYRGKDKDGEEQDYLLAWCAPSLVFLIRNKSYCEIGGVDDFQERWHSLKKKLVKSDYSSSAKSAGFEIEAEIGKGDRPKFTAIIKCP